METVATVVQCFFYNFGVSSNEVYILSGHSMKYGRPEAHASLSHSGCVLRQYISNFVEKMMSYVILRIDRICRFFDKNFYDAKLIF